MKNSMHLIPVGFYLSLSFCYVFSQSSFLEILSFPTGECMHLLQVSVCVHACKPTSLHVCVAFICACVCLHMCTCVDVSAYHPMSNVSINCSIYFHLWTQECCQNGNSSINSKAVYSFYEESICYFISVSSQNKLTV